MRISAILLAGLAAAAPLDVDVDSASTAALLEERQSTGTTRNDLINGACKDITFIFARGSTEVGNLGGTVGLDTAQGLERAYPGRVAVQGVTYPAGLGSNFYGGSVEGIAESERLFRLAASKCPNTIVVAGGYSQGAALMHRSIPDVSAAVRNQIAGVVTYGDTYNLQDGGRIDNYPPERLRIFCNAGDLVCVGTLTITPAHLAYGPSVPAAVTFLRSRIDATLKA